MCITGFLSLWISNTAVTAMMLPIVISLVKNIVKLDPVFHDEKPKPIDFDLDPDSISYKPRLTSIANYQLPYLSSILLVYSL